MKVNGKEYKIPELDFQAMCDIEDTGVSIVNMKEKFMKTIRGFVALAMGGDYEKAAFEIQQHVMGGGDLTGIYEEITKAVENSDFFQKIIKGSQEKKE